MTTSLKPAFLALVLCICLFIGIWPAAAQSLGDAFESYTNTEDTPVSPDQPVVPPPTPAADTPTPPGPASGTGAADDVAAMRRKIVEVASAEVGQVNASAGPDGFKNGWARLCGYYQTAYRLKDIYSERPTWASQLKAPNKRIEPQPKHWCGIFTAWAWMTAGLPVHWDTRIVGCKYRADFANLDAGDIAIVKLAHNPAYHHLLIQSRNGDTVMTINGNSTNQGVLLKEMPVSHLELFYSVADALGKPLTPGGGTGTGGGATAGGGGSGGSTTGGGGGTPKQESMIAVGVMGDWIASFFEVFFGGRAAQSKREVQKAVTQGTPSDPIVSFGERIGQLADSFVNGAKSIVSNLVQGLAKSLVNLF